MGAYIAKILGKNERLRELYLGIEAHKVGCNDIGKEGVKKFYNALKDNRTLAVLAISKYSVVTVDGNKIGMEGMKYLGEALKCNGSLIALHAGIFDIPNVDYNEAGFEGAKHIAEALGNNNRLISLYFSMI